MNKQRKVVITTTYNDMGIVIDTKAEELAQSNLQPTCNQLATDTISRQAAIDAAALSAAEWDGMYVQDINGRIREALEKLPSAQSEQTGHWVHEEDAYFCSECGVGLLEYGQSGEPIYFVEGYDRDNHERRNIFPAWQSWAMNYCPHCGAKMEGETT